MKSSINRKITLVGLSLMMAVSIASAQTSSDEEWGILQSGATSSKPEQRASTMRVLQLLPNNAKAIGLAEEGLKDKQPAVRAAAALSLGAMKSKAPIPKLRAALYDKDGSVVMAVAKALTQLGDEKGYSVYYAIVTGTRKSGEGLIGSEEKELDQVLSSPKQLTAMAFEQGIGYVPYGGVAFGVYQAIHKSEEAGPEVRSVAIRVLATDPDPRSGKALVAMTTNKDWLVRNAAFDGLARRDEKSLLPDILGGLKDENEGVKITAAAAIIRLSE